MVGSALGYPKNLAVPCPKVSPFHAQMFHFQTLLGGPSLTGVNFGEIGRLNKKCSANAVISRPWRNLQSSVRISPLFTVFNINANEIPVWILDTEV